MNNIFNLSSFSDTGEELFETILEKGEIEKGKGLKLERILSFGNTTPEGEWYDQQWDEWVMVVQGYAILEYDDGQKVTLHRGDYLTLPAHIRHRVSFTSEECIWLALHFTGL